MSVLSVADAAVRLGVGERRVRQLLERGELAGRRVGRVWVVDEVGLDRADRRSRGRGRRYGGAGAWRLLLMSAGWPVSGSDNELARARRRLREGSLVDLAPKLSRRGVVRRFRAHSGVLDRLRVDPVLVRSGVSAAFEVGADVVAVDEVEGYVSSSAVEGLVARYALDEGAERPNVVLRVVDEALWPFGPGQVVAPVSAVAVDLLEADDERTRRAGLALASTL